MGLSNEYESGSPVAAFRSIDWRSAIRAGLIGSALIVSPASVGAEPFVQDTLLAVNAELGAQDSFFRSCGLHFEADRLLALTEEAQLVILFLSSGGDLEPAVLGRLRSQFARSANATRQASRKTDRGCSGEDIDRIRYQVRSLIQRTLRLAARLKAALNPAEERS